MTRYVVVSGTGTEIGKTVVTAALAALLRGEGQRVGVAKPLQTGLEPGEEGDCGFAVGLSGADAAFEYRRLPEALAPETAVRAWVCGQEDLDVVLVEGASGVLARLGAPVVLVAEAGLGTLSNTELAVNHLRAAGVDCAGLVIGSWPAEPDLAQRCNAEDLPRLTGVPLVGRVPFGAGRLDPEAFRRGASGWFSAGWVPAS